MKFTSHLRSDLPLCLIQSPCSFARAFFMGWLQTGAQEHRANSTPSGLWPIQWQLDKAASWCTLKRASSDAAQIASVALQLKPLRVVQVVHPCLLDCPKCFGKNDCQVRGHAPPICSIGLQIRQRLASAWGSGCWHQCSKRPPDPLSIRVQAIDTNLRS